MPRAKTAKKYRKTMAEFSRGFGHRPPYQILVDADIVADMTKFTMPLEATFQKTLGDKVKLLITQCSMRHLYDRKDEPGIHAAIENAKELERRRCGHHPDSYAEPLSTLDCISQVVGSNNKHKYVVASNDGDVRKAMRSVPGVPICYVSRSVCIMEPMSSGTAHVRAKEEKEKFGAEIVRPGGKKRKREDEEEEADGNPKSEQDAVEPEKKKVKGPKGPNPLSVKKKQPKPRVPEKRRKPTLAPAEENDSTEAPTKKRKRKHKTKVDAQAGSEVSQTASKI